MNKLIYGKDPVQRIVASEVKDNYLINYIANGDKTEKERRDFYYYVLIDQFDRTRNDVGRLGGKNTFKYFVRFQDKTSAYQYSRSCEARGIKTWRCYNPVESAMLREGFTYYKGMTIDQVSCLSFDIETTGVTINENSFVLLISNTFRDRSGNITRRLFSFDDYDKPHDFIVDWCKWVREMDPDILLGHNIFSFDLPYLHNFAKLHNTKINLGRNTAAIKIDNKPRQFRKDGSQTYSYNNVHCFGREIIDTMFLSIKYDVTRKYPSYGLKPIIAYEGLEKEGRQHWDFSKNKEPWSNAADWIKFKQYAEDDADDALALFDLMAPQFFYYTQSIPKPFQEIINTATGSQVNSFMCRAYLQESESIPEPSERADYEGAISFGNPGLYHNVFKVDVASLYPSIMLTYEVTDRKKDPDNKFLRAVEFFTKQRLENKRLAAETGERYYKDLSNGQKIMINSFYGFLGATGLNFNYPEGAAEITRQGRNILEKAIYWAEEQNLRIVNADTDSISYEAARSDSMEDHLKSLNYIMPEGIVWESDGIYDAILVVKAKNYALKQGDKVTIKGSALKATMKEKDLVEFLEQSILSLLTGNEFYVLSQYSLIAKKIRDGAIDIAEWASKKTITKAILNPERTNEQRVADALVGKNFQEGDKVRMFFETPTKLCLVEDYKGVYDKDKLLEKLYKTVKVLEPVLNMADFPNYKLKKNKQLLEQL